MCGERTGGILRKFSRSVGSPADLDTADSGGSVLACVGGTTGHREPEPLWIRAADNIGAGWRGGVGRDDAVLIARSQIRAAGSVAGGGVERVGAGSRRVAAKSVENRTESHSIPLVVQRKII